mmetsp:Transcript_25038/g.68033  ORF Transcript_25038/g.68033 Transcript_25038/m.68033 type:complete len:488 (-) Transcript_25038:327-1790(-)
MQVLVPGVLRVDSHSCIAQHGLRARGSHHNLAASLQRVRKAGEHAELHRLSVARHRHQGTLWHVNVLHLNIRDSSLELAAPVDQAVVAVDGPIIVHAHKGLIHSTRHLGVHGKYAAAPVHRGSDAAQLVRDATSVHIHPLVHLLQKALTPQLVARDTLLSLQRLLHDCLCGNACMVRARHPHGVVAAHAPPAYNGVLDRVGEGVADVQCSRDVGWGNDDDKRRLGAVHVRLEVARRFPPVIPGSLHDVWVVSLARCLAHVLLGTLGDCVHLCLQACSLLSLCFPLGFRSSLLAFACALARCALLGGLCSCSGSSSLLLGCQLGSLGFLLCLLGCLFGCLLRVQLRICGTSTILRGLRLLVTTTAATLFLLLLGVFLGGGHPALGGRAQGDPAHNFGNRRMLACILQHPLHGARKGRPRLRAHHIAQQRLHRRQQRNVGNAQAGRARNALCGATLLRGCSKPVAFPQGSLKTVQLGSEGGLAGSAPLI